MIAALAGAHAACMLLFLGAIALERARAYALHVTPLTWSSALAGAVAIGVSAWVSSPGAPTTPVVLACAAVSAATDVQTGYVFDRVLLATALVLLTLTMVDGGFLQASGGAAAAAALLLIPYVCSRGRGVGLGDVKLAATIGFGLGTAGTFAALWFAAICGGSWAATLLCFGRVHRRARIPFAPFLVAGAAYATLRLA
ncbi:MAG: A24 family peptidase [Candidatus Tumulicola sp.]